MADLCSANPCNCTPYENICCCPPISGITASQPACQVIPNGNIVINPCFCEQEGNAYFTYKFYTDCARNTRAISSIAIPVCEQINKAHITVEEQINGCGGFAPVPFSVSKTDPNFGEAPEGFNFLKIEIDDRFDVGVYVIYRLAFRGNFPVGVQPLQVKAANQIIVFDCEPEDCYLVPKCPEEGKLLLVKECIESIVNNQVTLLYNIEVANTGNATLNSISYSDQINYDPTNLTIGTVVVTPPTLNVDTSIPGVINITGTLGPLAPGDVIPVSYEVPIISIANPGTFLVTSNTNAVAEDTEASSTCTLNINAVKLIADKCCIVTDLNRGVFRITITSDGNSPETSVDLTDQLIVPPGVRVQFTNFDNCTATFPDGSPVPLNTNITDRTINISCPSVTVPQGGSATKNIRFTVVSTNIQAPASITNTLQRVTFLNTDTQIFLGVSPVPVSASIEVVGLVECGKPCNR